MKVFYCSSLDQSLEMGCMVVAESLQEAKTQLTKRLIQDEWELPEKYMDLIELDTSKAHAILIDPLRNN